MKKKTLEELAHDFHRSQQKMANKYGPIEMTMRSGGKEIGTVRWEPKSAVHGAERANCSPEAGPCNKTQGASR